MASRPCGFSIIELLIVVTMLAIIAMLVMPHLLDASQDARDSALASDLQMLRRQIELYRIQHEGRGPHLDENGTFDGDGFTDRLTERTTVTGKLDASGEFGPYVSEWPGNPFSTNDVAKKILFGTQQIPPRNGTTGWYYNTKSCLISPNSKKGAPDFDPAEIIEANALPLP